MEALQLYVCFRLIDGTSVFLDIILQWSFTMWHVDFGTEMY